MTKSRHSDRGEAGFSLIEVLVAMILMVLILSALTTVTAQWLPNWKRGYERVRRLETMSLGLERLVADLSAAQFVYASRTAKKPLFDGDELAVTFVRSAIGPNTPPGLEIVRIAETNDHGESAVVRTRARFVPAPPDGTILPSFSDPVVLVQAPYRISFSYAGTDRVWRSRWQDADRLPNAIRISVRDVASDQILPISTVAVVHVDAPAECVGQKPPLVCAPPKAAGNDSKVVQ